MFPLHRALAPSCLPTEEACQKATPQQAKAFICDISIVEAQNNINVYIKRYFILVFWWGFYCLI